MKRLLIIALFLVLFIMGSIGLKFGSALFQEGNPTPILTSIVKLEFSNNPYEKVTEINQTVRYVSKNERGIQETIIKDLLAEKDWEFKEQMGSAYFFEKNKMTIAVETRLYTKNYFLWDVPLEK